MSSSDGGPSARSHRSPEERGSSTCDGTQKSSSGMQDAGERSIPVDAGTLLSVLDKNLDGQISMTELRRNIRQLHQLPCSSKKTQTCQALMVVPRHAAIALQKSVDHRRVTELRRVAPGCRMQASGAYQLTRAPCYLCWTRTWMGRSQ
mmetsp:Transcript_42642/g.92936  ORF Transcript_42642/g.92936 Transcript_42642/m.92936 type:complete len:148 (-) Transcript_42642:34-477(-)